MSKVSIEEPVKKKRGMLLAAFLLLALASLRLIHLEADTPFYLIYFTKSLGIYVDEGYKTLAPRNLSLFDDKKWHPGDDFPGWMDPSSTDSRYRYSPLTQWYSYLAFQVLGPHLGSVRMASVLLFTLLLVGYVYAMFESYSRGLLALGLVLLSLQNLLFFYTRLALFVMPVVLCIYWMLFLIRRLESRPIYLTFGVVLVFSAIMTFGVRSSAPVYIAPIALGVVVSWWLNSRQADARRIWVVAGFAAVGVALLAGYTYPLWGHKIFALKAYKNLFLNILLSPLYAVATTVAAAGFLCAFHILLTHPRQYLESSYRTCLLMIIFLGPVPLGIFVNQPLRYHIPFLPAYLLLVLEWIHTRAWQRKIPRRVPWMAGTLCVAILIGTICGVAHGVNEQILKKLEVVLGNGPGLSTTAMMSYIVPLAIPLSLFLWAFKRRIFQGKVIAGLIACSLSLATLQDIYLVGSFLSDPSYRSREISEEIRKIIPQDGSLAGDWAPFFALGTDLKVLFTNKKFNKPSRLQELRPSHFLFCKTPKNLNIMDGLEGAVVGPPVYVSTYTKRRVALHPLSWEDAGWE